MALLWNKMVWHFKFFFGLQNPSASPLTTFGSIRPLEKPKSMRQQQINKAPCASLNPDKCKASLLAHIMYSVQIPFVIRQQSHDNDFSR